MMAVSVTVLQFPIHAEIESSSADNTVQLLARAQFLQTSRLSRSDTSYARPLASITAIMVTTCFDFRDVFVNHGRLELHTELLVWPAL